MMKKLLSAFPLCAILILFSAPPAKTQNAAIDPVLAEEINKIRAVDNHAHPLRAVAEGERADDEYDALVSAIEEFPLPVRLRPDNPEYIAAWRALYDYRHADASEAHARELMQTRQRIIREQGDAYPAWVLDRVGTEVMLANRVALGRGLAARSGREALAIALTGMLRDGEITRERALELARMVLRENAIRLYGLGAK